MKPMFVYHKYDATGNIQFYIAQSENKKWVSHQITNWDYRWEFSGGGSIIFEVVIKDFQKRDDGYYEVSYYHIKHGHGTILLNDKLENCGKVIKPQPLNETLKKEGVFPGLKVNILGDIGRSEEKGVRYVLKWETLSANRDRPYPEPWPQPSQLYLLKLGSPKLSY